MAPVRVAMITSPEPMYSAVQTKDGPTRAKMAKPVAGRVMESVSDRSMFCSIASAAFGSSYSGTWVTNYEYGREINTVAVESKFEI